MSHFLFDIGPGSEQPIVGMVAYNEFMDRVELILCVTDERQSFRDKRGYTVLWNIIAVIETGEIVWTSWDDFNRTLIRCGT